MKDISRRKSYTQPKLSSIDELQPTETPTRRLYSNIATQSLTNKSKCTSCNSINEHILKHFICSNCKMMNFN